MSAATGDFRVRQCAPQIVRTWARLGQGLTAEDICDAGFVLPFHFEQQRLGVFCHSYRDRSDDDAHRRAASRSRHCPPAAETAPHRHAVRRERPPRYGRYRPCSGSSCRRRYRRAVNLGRTRGIRIDRLIASKGSSASFRRRIPLTGRAYAAPSRRGPTAGGGRFVLHSTGIHASSHSWLRDHAP